MIKIFNKKLNKAIEIDNSIPEVGFSPREYDLENPHILIKLPSLNFSKHANACSDCKAFRSDFGTNSIDWYISYLNKTYRLDLNKFSSKYFDNLQSFKSSEDFYGTEFKLDITSIEELQNQLSVELDSENYEACSILRDKISGISDLHNL